MVTRLARQLQGKTIVGIDGTDFGTLENITTGAEPGTIEELIVEPQDHVPERTQLDADGRFRLPLERIENVDDRIVISSD